MDFAEDAQRSLLYLVMVLVNEPPRLNEDRDGTGHRRRRCCSSRGRRSDDVAGAVVGAEDAAMCILADDVADEMQTNQRTATSI